MFVVALSRNSIKRDETKRRERDRSTSPWCVVQPPSRPPTPQRPLPPIALRYPCNSPALSHLTPSLPPSSPEPSVAAVQWYQMQRRGRRRRRRRRRRRKLTAANGGRRKRERMGRRRESDRRTRTDGRTDGLTGGLSNYNSNILD